jgi:hypothetical protein
MSRLASSDRTHEGGTSHAAKPAPASRPDAKTAMPVITRPGVSDARVLRVARRGSAMGTHQRSPTPARIRSTIRAGSYRDIGRARATFARASAATPSARADVPPPDEFAKLRKNANCCCGIPLPRAASSVLPLLASRAKFCPPIGIQMGSKIGGWRCLLIPINGHENEGPACPLKCEHSPARNRRNPAARPPNSSRPARRNRPIAPTPPTGDIS